MSRPTLNRRTLKFLGLAILVVLAAIPCFGFTARDALASTPGALSISPAQRVIVGVPPMSLTPGVIDNTTALRFHVVVYPVFLHQEKLGSYNFDLSSRRAAARIVRVTPSSFTLDSERSMKVRVRWQLRGGRPRAAYIGLLYRAVPVTAGGTVRTIEQLLNVNLLTVPGTRPAVPTLHGVLVQQYDKRDLEFTTVVRNIGATAASPDVVAMTVRRSGSTVRTQLLALTGPVLPRATRDFTTFLTHRLRGGSYTLSARVVMGGRTVSEQTRFKLDAGGQIAQPRLTPRAITASGPPGGRATVTVPVANVGNVPARPVMRLSLHELDHGVVTAKAMATKVVRAKSIPPGRTAVVTARLGSLSGDSYEVDAQYLWPSSPNPSASVDFHALTLPTDRSSGSNNPADLIPALVAALAASIGVAAGIRRRHLHI